MVIYSDAVKASKTCKNEHRKVRNVRMYEKGTPGLKEATKHRNV